MTKSVDTNILNDNIALEGRTRITIQNTDNVIKYFVFTATSINSLSTNLTIQYNEADWNLEARIVKCVDDNTGKSYAIRVVIPNFTPSNSEETKREFYIQGRIYTNSQLSFTDIDLKIEAINCKIDTVYQLKIDVYSDENGELASYLNRNITNHSGDTIASYSTVAREWRIEDDDDVWDSDSNNYSKGYYKVKNNEFADGSVKYNSLDKTSYPSGFFAVNKEKLSYNILRDDINNQYVLDFNEPCLVIGYHTFYFGETYSQSQCDLNDNKIHYKNKYGQVKLIGGECVHEDDVLFTGSTYLFNYASKIKNISLGNNITTICSNAFRGLHNMSSINFGESKTKTICESAFESCSSLSSITLPNTIEHIGEKAFRNSGLKSIIIPKNIKIIEAGVFDGCQNLSSITFNNDSLTKISGYSFRNTGLASLQLPQNLTTIARGAFYESKLSSISFPESIKYIDSLAFYNCFNLTSITFDLKSSIETIKSNTFVNCKPKELSLPINLKTIEKGGFKGCSSITKIRINGTDIPNCDSNVFDIITTGSVTIELTVSAKQACMSRGGTGNGWLDEKIYETLTGVENNFLITLI